MLCTTDNTLLHAHFYVVSLQTNTVVAFQLLQLVRRFPSTCTAFNKALQVTGVIVSKLM